MRWLFATYIAVAVVFAVIVGVSIAIYLRFSDKLNSKQARRWRCFFNLLLRTPPLSSYTFYIFFYLFGTTGKMENFMHMPKRHMLAFCVYLRFIFHIIFFWFFSDFISHPLPHVAATFFLLILLLRAAVFFYSLTMMPQSITTRRCHMLTHTKI